MEVLFIVLGITGIVMSVFFYRLRRGSERRSLKILSQELNEIEANLKNLEIEALNKRKVDFDNSDLNDSEIQLYQVQLSKIHEVIKSRIENKINEKDSKVLFSNLEQKYISGRVNYLNKILNKIGSEKYVSLIKDKRAS